MARKLVKIEYEQPNWLGKLKAKERELHLFIAATMQTNRGMLFDKEGAYNGHSKWAELKFRNGQILSDSGTLRKSIGPTNARGRAGSNGIVELSGDKVTIGTKLAYARLMNDGTTKLPGGVLTADKAKALMIPLPAGKRATDAAKSLRKGAISRSKLTTKINALAKKVVTIAKSGSKDARSKTEKMNQQINILYAKRSALEKAGAKKTENVIFRKSVKIPAREFDTWTTADQDELEAALARKITEVLNG